MPTSVPADAMADLEFPKLTHLLGEYVGALQLHALGNVDARYVEHRLRALTSACRAADRIMVMLGKPPIERQRRREQPGVN